MTSITASSYQHPAPPRERLQNVLNSQVSAGKISSADSTALSGALDDIDASMQSDRLSGASGGQRPSPDEMKQKLDGLIANEVKNGKLTDEQGAQLQDLFATAFQQGGPSGAAPGGGPGGPGGHEGGPPVGGHRGPPPGGAPAGGPNGGGPGGSDATKSQNASGSDANQLLQDFMKLLQDNQNSTGYDTAGSIQSNTKSLLLDYQS